MLVLSRKVDEKIMIGEDVEVTVVRLDSGRVRLGIDAPPDKRIVRSELLRQDPPLEPDEKAA